MKKHFTFKNISFIFIFLVMIFFLGKNLLPSKTMFEFHDETQAARVQQFSLNIQKGILPPRMAPQFSFNLSYPVFNFYSPFAYWITSSFHILGLDVADSLKLSFLLAIAIAFLGMYAFLNLYFKFIPAVTGAILYVATPWLASEIFVRGNVGEVWFWGLFPLALYTIYELTEYDSPIIFVATTFILSCTLTVHNIFSLLFLPIAILYIWITGSRLKSYGALGLALLLSSYFLIPVLFESSLTHAREVATLTKYTDHFLCLNQLWAAPFWGFGGSARGCVNDGMAYMLGKIQIIFGLLGLIVLLIPLFHHDKKNSTHHSHKSLYKETNTKIYMFIAILTIGSLFLTLYPSQFIWEIFSPILSLFQFPWRFLFFGVFGLSFFASYLFNRFGILKIIAPFVILYTAFSTSKYFYKSTVSKEVYNQNYLSENYIENSVAYKIPEYLPTLANYDVWRKLEGKNFRSNEVFIRSQDKKVITIAKNGTFKKEAITDSNTVILHIHYFPYWKIFINNKEYTPKHFDPVGRPIISTSPGKKTVTILYEQTAWEKLGNTLTIVAFLTLMGLLTKPFIFKEKRYNTKR